MRSGAWPGAGDGVAREEGLGDRGGSGRGRRAGKDGSGRWAAGAGRARRPGSAGGGQATGRLPGHGESDLPGGKSVGPRRPSDVTWRRQGLRPAGPPGLGLKPAFGSGSKAPDVGISGGLCSKPTRMSGSHHPQL